MGTLAMKTTILFLLVGVSGLVLLGGAQLVTPPSPPPPTRGKVLLLDNEQTLLGDIERVGDQFRIRREVGETWVPSQRVVTLCANMEETLQFLRGRSNLRDPDERLRLANWCRQNGLHDHALVEVRAAALLRPDHAPTKRLLQLLQEVQSARATSVGTESEPVPVASVDLSAEALAQFTTRVQPILMNACANCHATGKGGAFKLTRTYSSNRVARRSAVSNAAAVLAQINLDQPHNSPLLTRAVAVHGEMTSAPFQNRQAAAFRALEDWVRLAVEQSPGREPAPLLATPTSSPTGLGGFASTRPGTSLPSPAEQTAPRQPPTLTTTPEPGTPRVVPTTPTPTPAPMPAPTGPVDPFDPATFNRQSTPMP